MKAIKSSSLLNVSLLIALCSIFFGFLYTGTNPAFSANANAIGTASVQLSDGHIRVLKNQPISLCSSSFDPAAGGLTATMAHSCPAALGSPEAEELIKKFDRMRADTLLNGTKTDINGCYQFNHLPPGSYCIVAMYSEKFRQVTDHKYWARRIFVKSGQVILCDLDNKNFNGHFLSINE